MPAHKSKHWQKLLFPFILSIFFFLFSVESFAEWVKYSGNPILEGTPGGWDASGVANTNVMFDKGVYKMWYGGSIGSISKIGYATSSSELNWQKRDDFVIGPNPIEGWDEREVGHVSVIYSDDKYEMWYVAVSPRWQGGYDTARVRYAASDDGIHWTLYPYYVLKGDKESWDSGGINRGISVVRVDGEYKMWYTGLDSANNWKIGLATSPDGTNWYKHPHNPILTKTEEWEDRWLSYPNVMYDGEFYHMWYTTTETGTGDKVLYAKSSDGIIWEKPKSENPVLIRGSSGSFDSVCVVTPSVIKQGNILKMWYSGFNGSIWRIGYAEGTLPEPTVTPTPTSTPLQPLILLPGLGASWNHRAMILEEDVPQTEWYMTPGIKVYDGLIETLKNAGYQTESPEGNLFIFNYNWTKPVSQITDDLKNYIETVVDPPEETKIDLVGHSLGGLVARAYVQNNSDHPVDQLLTLGSPHQGVAQVYYPWEGGDLRQIPAWQRLSIGLLLYLKSPGFSITKQTIQEIIPGLKNLLPTFDYLKQNSTPKPVGEMIEKNDWLIDLNISPPAYLLSALNTFVGNIFNTTLRWIKVENRGWLDAVLNLWPDGKPSGETETADGDETILVQSGQLWGTGLTELSGLNHRDLVESIDGQQAIIDALGLSPSSISTISAGVYYEPALVFQLASPATLTILGPDDTPVGEGDGKLMVVTNAVLGEYQATVNGTENGNYQLHIGQFLPTGDFWTTVAGSITPGQITPYKISFQPDAPLENPLIDPTGQNFKESARAKLQEIDSKILSAQIKRIIKQIDQGKIEAAIITCYQLRRQINIWQWAGRIDTNTGRLWKNKIQQVIDDLEHAYIISKTAGGGVYTPRLLAKEMSLTEGLFQKMEDKLKILEHQGKATPDDGALYLLAQEKLNQAKNSSSYEAHIKAMGCRYLSLEGMFLFRL